MTWQDELRRLDDELADGMISDAEYRRRSEDLIATASAVPAKPLTHRPVSQRQATEGHYTDQEAAKADSPPRPEPPEPRREVPRTPQPRRPEPTRAPEPAREPATAVPPSPEVTLPPHAAAQPAHESLLDDAFTRSPPSRRTRHTLVLGAGALTVIVAAAAVWFFAFRQPTPDAAAPTTGPARPTAAVPIPNGLAARMNHLPGRRVSSRDTIDVGRLDGLGICSGRATKALRNQGVSRALYLTSLDGAKSFSVTVVPHRSAASAHRTSRDVLATQHRLRLADSDRMGLPPSVSVLARAGTGGTRLRAVYTSGTASVVLGGTAGAGGGDLAVEFARLATRMTGELPPS